MKIRLLIKKLVIFPLSDEIFHIPVILVRLLSDIDIPPPSFPPSQKYLGISDEMTVGTDLDQEFDCRYRSLV